jgi:hypothetical protein
MLPVISIKLISLPLPTTTLVSQFGLTAAYPDANRRYFAFMPEGRRNLSRHLKQRSIDSYAAG